MLVQCVSCQIPSSFFPLSVCTLQLQQFSVSFKFIITKDERRTNLAHIFQLFDQLQDPPFIFVSRHTLISPNFFSSPNMDWVSGEGLQIDIGNCILFLSAASVSYLCMYLHLFNDFVMFSTQQCFQFLLLSSSQFFIDLKNSTHIWLKTVQTSKPFLVV